MNKPLVSVLLPVYNTKEEYLRECIESILNQTFKDFELIILNDGSTNNAEDVIKSYTDSRIRYYKNEKSEGITTGRNKLLELANGKYIAVTDHDDISVPERFEKEFNFLENNPDVSIVSSWLDIFWENGKRRIDKFMPNPRFLDFLEGCVISHPACMYRKADFEKYNLKYEDGYYGAQDYALFAKAARYLKLANIQECLLKYRFHETNASKNRQKMCPEIRKVQTEMLEFLTADKQEQIRLFDRYVLHEKRLTKNIFSIENKSDLKIVRILGYKIKLKRF